MSTGAEAELIEPAPPMHYERRDVVPSEGRAPGAGSPGGAGRGAGSDDADAGAGLAVADLDGDLDLDLLVASPRGVQWVENQGSGKMAARRLSGLDALAGEAIRGIVVGDYDNDTTPDSVGADRELGAIVPPGRESRVRRKLRRSPRRWRAAPAAARRRWSTSITTATWTSSSAVSQERTRRKARRAETSRRRAAWLCSGTTGTAPSTEVTARRQAWRSVRPRAPSSDRLRQSPRRGPGRRPSEGHPLRLFQNQRDGHFCGRGGRSPCCRAQRATPSASATSTRTSSPTSCSCSITDGIRSGRSATDGGFARSRTARLVRTTRRAPWCSTTTATA